MNTYSKYAPNVFLAKCTEQHEKGSVIPVETKYGKDNDSIVFNLIYQKDGFYYYSIIRADGFNYQEWVKRKADRRNSWAAIAENKSNDYFVRSNKDAAFLSLWEPIKIGHHSEKRHRDVIDQQWSNMGKSVAFTRLAATHESKAAHWESKVNEINESMPESIDYFTYKLEVATAHHKGLKSGAIVRDHSMSLQYANRDVKELKKKLDLAIRLWK